MDIEHAPRLTKNNREDWSTNNRSGHCKIATITIKSRYIPREVSRHQACSRIHLFTIWSFDEYHVILCFYNATKSSRPLKCIYYFYFLERVWWVLLYKLWHWNCDRIPWLLLCWYVRSTSVIKPLKHTLKSPSLYSWQECRRLTIYCFIYNLDAYL